MTITWETPEPSKGGRNSTKWSSILDQVRTRPGEWAFIGETSSAGMIAGLKKRFPGEFEFAVRGTRPDLRLYARYIASL